MFHCAEICLSYLLSHGRFKTQVSGAQLPGVKCQVSGVSGEVPGVRCQAPSVRNQIARDRLFDIRDQVPRQNVEKLDIKKILRLNRNYKLILFSTEITDIQANFSPC